MTIQNWLFIKDIKSEINSRGEDRKYCQGPKTISCYLGGHSKLAREENKACITSCNLYWAFYKLELQPGGEKRHYQCKTIVKNKIMETRHFQHLPFLKHLARQQILLTNWCKSLYAGFFHLKWLLIQNARKDWQRYLLWLRPQKIWSMKRSVIKSTLHRGGLLMGAGKLNAVTTIGSPVL